MVPGEFHDKGSANHLLVFLPLFGCAISVTFFFLFLFELGYFYGGVANLAFGLLFLVPLIFFQINQVSYGKHLMALLFLADVLVHSYLLFPTESYFHLFLVSAFPLVFMVFDSSEKRSRGIYSVAVALLLIAIHFFGNDSLRPFNFQQDDVAFVRNTNLVASFLLLAISSIIYVRLIEHRASESSKLASTDALTGLGNRRYFKYLGDQQINMAERNGHALSLLFIDIDDFKEVNDSKGHHIGDLVLQGVAQGMRKHGRASDVLARTGGDEFQVLLPGATMEAATQVAAAMRRTIFRECFDVSKEEIRVSIGVAEYESGDTIEMLAARADQELYQDKTDFKMAREDDTPLRDLVG